MSLNKKIQELDLGIKNILIDLEEIKTSNISKLNKDPSNNILTPVIDKNKAQLITTPITLFTAENDVIFPGKKMLKRANKIFPSLKKGILLESSKHVQSKNNNLKIEQIITSNKPHKN